MAVIQDFGAPGIGGGGFDFGPMNLGSPAERPYENLGARIPQPAAGQPGASAFGIPTPAGQAGATPGAGAVPPGYGAPQDLMRQIMMMILGPQLQRFFGGGQQGWGPVAGEQSAPQWGGQGTAQNPTGLGTMPNPAQWGQGPAGMMQGPMSFLAPFIMSQFMNRFQMQPGGGTGMQSNYGAF